MSHPLWRKHPGVRADGQLTLGERAADKMRNSMGSWMFVFGALVFLGIWMVFNGNSGFDKYPFILLNLVLSCLAAMQGAILLIAAKRSDQISAELAQHDYETDQAALAELKANTALTEALHALAKAGAEQNARIEALTEQVAELVGGTRKAIPQASEAERAES